jgi:hypothetical protein
VIICTEQYPIFTPDQTDRVSPELSNSHLHYNDSPFLAPPRPLKAHLEVDVAQRPPHGVQHILNLDRRPQLAHIQEIFNRSISARRGVAERNRAIDLVRLAGVQHLPDPVHAVDHGVVLIERGVVERGEDVRPVASHGVVAGAVQAQRAVRALELVLKVPDGLRGRADGQVEQVGGGKGRRGRGHGQVAALAARVERLDIVVDGEVALHGGLLGADVDGLAGGGLEIAVYDNMGLGEGVLDKGARLDAAAAGARREPDAPGADYAAVVRKEVAVTTQARVAAVKEGRQVEVVLVLEPVPVLRE